MIARMSKYDLVLYAGQSSDFIEKLRGLGLVDITTTGWEPSDEDRQLLLTIDNHHKAVETLKRFLEDERFVKDEQPIADGGEAFDRYMAATQQAAALRSEIARLQKTADELRPWGDFSVDTLRKLADKGVVLRYFFTSRAAYEKDIEAWSERYTIALVHEGETFDDFVVVTRPGEEVVLDAQARAMYFSRGAIPFQRASIPGNGASHGSGWLPDAAPAALRHVGIYGYRVQFLKQFPTLPPAPVEQAEALEQLRALWHGHRIAVHVTKETPGPGVDTPDDLARVRHLMA